MFQPGIPRIRLPLQSSPCTTFAMQHLRPNFAFGLVCTLGIILFPFPSILANIHVFLLFSCESLVSVLLSTLLTFLFLLFSDAGIRFHGFFVWMGPSHLRNSLLATWSPPTLDPGSTWLATAVLPTGIPWKPSPPCDLGSRPLPDPSLTNPNPYPPWMGTNPGASLARWGFLSDERPFHRFWIPLPWMTVCARGPGAAEDRPGSEGVAKIAPSASIGVATSSRDVGLDVIHGDAFASESTRETATNIASDASRNPPRRGCQKT